MVYPPGAKDSVVVTRPDLECLQADEFLNDTVVDFYLKYIWQQLPAIHKPYMYFFNSFFYKRYITADRGESYARVKQWTKGVDLFEKRFVFVPINQNLHWSLVVICFPGETAWQPSSNKRKVSKDKPGIVERVISFGNSLLGGSSSSSSGSSSSQGSSAEPKPTAGRACMLHFDSLGGMLHERPLLQRKLNEYLSQEWSNRKGKERTFKLHLKPVQVPQQTNSSDCGLFLLKFAQLFASEPLDSGNITLDHRKWFDPRSVQLGMRKQLLKLLRNLHLQGNKRCSA